MHEYSVRFLDEGYLDFEDDRPTIEGKSEKSIVKHLWDNEKDHIEKIMAGKLIIYEGERMLLYVNDDNEWYDLADGKNVSIKYLQHLNDVAHKKVSIKKLNSKQFNNLVMLMVKDLCNEYGAAYLEFYEKKNGEWVELH